MLQYTVLEGRANRGGPHADRSVPMGLCGWSRAGAALAVAALVAACQSPARAEPPEKARVKIFGLDRVIAFTYKGDKNNPNQIKSMTFTWAGPKNKDWQKWASRGVVTSVGHTWFDLLKNPVDKAVDILVKQDCGAGNPMPIVSIDEFGMDLGGGADQKAAKILRETKRRRPELGLTVWEMGGPIPKALGDCYRDVADLVMLESYMRGKEVYWFAACQVQSARVHKIVDKTIVGLGIGKGGNPGEDWANTTEELEQQIRFVRMIAPESPGMAFFGGSHAPDIIAKADEMCSHYFDIPSDGSKLPADVVALGKFFSERHAKPTLVCSPTFTQPNRTAEDPNKLVEPKTMRVWLLNIGDADATNVHVQLRNPKDHGGDVFPPGSFPSFRSTKK